jgi:hypothetical protein
MAPPASTQLTGAGAVLFAVASFYFQYQGSHAEQKAATCNTDAIGLYRLYEEADEKCHARCMDLIREREHAEAPGYPVFAEFLVLAEAEAKPTPTATPTPRPDYQQQIPEEVLRKARELAK